jgi:von Willebrand factor type A domain
VNTKHGAVAAVALSLGGLYLWQSRGTSVASAHEPPRVDPGVASPASPPPPPATPPVVESPQPVSANDNPPPKNPPAPPRVDLVFALDTTSSMGGMIEGAKAKIWDIARRAQQGKPAPRLRVGLVAFRDVGDAYLTKVLDLTSDMDAVYARLSELRAEGGGDSPEHVLKGLHDALDEEHWSQDPSAIKLVYLVGDAPPHTDYQDGITLAGVLRDANGKGIRISAIRCGNDPQTLASWTEIAHKTDGEVASIAENGGVATIATPYDGELARLNAALAKTEVHWGSAAERREADESVARGLAAPAPAQASRAAFYGSLAAAHAAPTKKDLAAATSPAPVASVAPADLPDEMQAMSVDERTKFVTNKQAERTAILAQVAVEAAKRDAYLKTKPASDDTSLDAKVYDSLKKAGAKQGIAF